MASYFFLRVMNFCGVTKTQTSEAQTLSYSKKITYRYEIVWLLFLLISLITFARYFYINDIHSELINVHLVSDIFPITFYIIIKLFMCFMFKIFIAKSYPGTLTLKFV
jgi:hypothetical protein